MLFRSVVGENGAFYFWHDASARRLRKRYIDADDERARHRARFAAIARRILAEVPGCALASDQAYRENDLAIDYCEDVAPLPLEAAARIAKSLDASLRKSEALIDVNRPQELERQRALIWALKDLARQLKRGGYNMDELFDLTDEMAAELGLPPHPEHKEK